MVLHSLARSCTALNCAEQYEILDVVFCGQPEKDWAKCRPARDGKEINRVATLSLKKNHRSGQPAIAQPARTTGRRKPWSLSSGAWHCGCRCAAVMNLHVSDVSLGDESS